MKTKKIAYTGVMTALVFLATFLFQIRVPFTNGYIHLGDSMIIIAAVLLGWKYGGFASGVGSMLSDLALGCVGWALPTLIIKTIMGVLIGYAVHQQKNKRSLIILSSIATLLWIGFNTFLKQLLNAHITPDSIHLVEDISGVDSMEQLIALTDKVQVQLFASSIAIPLIFVLIVLFLRQVIPSKLKSSYLLSYIVAGIWMVFGYYITYNLLYGNYITPIFSVPLNIVQYALGFIIAEVVLYGLKGRISLSTSIQ